MGPIFFHIRRKLAAARAEARKAGGDAAVAIEQTHRIYGYRLLLTGALWASVYGLSRGLLEMGITERPVRIAVALIPIPFFASFLWLWMKGVGTMDELERRIQLEALALAFPLMAVLMMTLQLLNVAGVETRFDWMWMMMPVLYYFSLWRAKRRYE